MTLQSAVIGSVALLLFGLSARGLRTSDKSEQPPILFVPGYGMSALRVEAKREQRSPAKINFLLPAMNPPEVFTEFNPPVANALDYARRSGLDDSDVVVVREWLKLDIRADGSAQNSRGIRVRPVSIGKDFLHECPRYAEMMQMLIAKGWVANHNLACIPFDYRYPPGETDFAEDLKKLIISQFALSQGRKVTIACHSQGCLLAYQFLRTQDPVWVARHIGLFYSLAGQFSGCSDCLRWAFQQEWSWDSHDKVASPSDMTWVGELALGLQSGIFGEAILYRWGQTSYRARDAQTLLREAGALAIAEATNRYALEKQTWFQKGARDHQPLPVPTRVVFGTGLLTTAGFDFAREKVPVSSCKDPQCQGLYSQKNPELIQTTGDQGDSAWMNRAPRMWLKHPDCEMKEFAGISHMEIFKNATVLNHLSKTIQETASGIDVCLKNSAPASRGSSMQ